MASKREAKEKAHAAATPRDEVEAAVDRVSKRREDDARRAAAQRRETTDAVLSEPADLRAGLLRTGRLRSWTKKPVDF